MGDNGYLVDGNAYRSLYLVVLWNFWLMGVGVFFLFFISRSGAETQGVLDNGWDLKQCSVFFLAGLQD